MPGSDGQRRGPLRHVHLEIVARWLAAELRLQRAVARRRLPAQRAVGQIDARDLAAAAVVAEARALVARIGRYTTWTITLIVASFSFARLTSLVRRRAVSCSSWNWRARNAGNCSSRLMCTAIAPHDRRSGTASRVRFVLAMFSSSLGLRDRRRPRIRRHPPLLGCLVLRETGPGRKA